MIIAGVGCRRGASASEVKAAIGAALAACKLGFDVLGLIATAQAKADEPGIVDAATSLGARLVPVSQTALAQAGGRVVTKSERVQELFGVPSVAEAAALAAGGPDARLLAPRIVVGPVTCALGEAP